MGSFLAGWAIVENAFFSSVIRLQEDRGQHVVRTGPYRILRYPGYAGGVLAAVATPLALGSLWALLPGCVLIILFIARTHLEDDTLQKGLPRYAEYSRATCYRLFPGIW